MTGKQRRPWIAVVAVAVAVACPAAALAQASAGTGGVSAVKGSAAQSQYGDEQPAAGQSARKKPGVLRPPVVLSSTQEAAQAEQETLPLTGAELVLPAVLGAVMLGLGLFLVYRTRRRES